MKGPEAGGDSSLKNGQEDVVPKEVITDKEVPEKDDEPPAATQLGEQDLATEQKEGPEDEKPKPTNKEVPLA